ncbi:MAG: hypothetical protein ACOYB1_09780 [Limnohabitans sp.]
MILFGAGKLIAVPTTDAAGNAIAVPTPVTVAVLQDVSVDFDFETKTLHGANQFAVTVARGKAKIGWKAKTGDFSAAALGSLLLGAQPTAARKGAVIDFAATIPATPFTVTIAPPDTGTFVADLGVTSALTGLPLTRVATAPATGQYSLSVATGVYTFAAADTLKPVLISYEYVKATDATSQLFAISNNLMGYTPTFSALFYNEYMGKKLVMKLNANVMGKQGLPFKNDDFTLTDFDAEAFADASSSVGYICQY